MKKLLCILIMALVCMMMVSCKKKEVDKLSNTELDKDDLGSYVYDVNKCELNDIPLVFISKLNTIDSYVKKTIGETIGKTIIKYTQTIDGTFTKTKDESHLLNLSGSLLVKLYHEAYYGDNIKYREKEKNDFTVATRNEYLEKFGLIPDDNNLEGFVISKDNIISVEKLEVEGCVYKVTLNGEIGGNNLKIQMKEFGSLSDYPVFSLVEITLYIEDDFTPIKVDFYSEYEVTTAVIGKIKCTQKYTATYTVEK